MTPKEKRAEILRLLLLLSDSHRKVFTSMYSPFDPTKDINFVVYDMKNKDLDWALIQCRNTYYELFKIIKNN